MTVSDAQSHTDKVKQNTVKWARWSIIALLATVLGIVLVVALQDFQENRIFEAAKAGDLETVSLLIEKNPDGKKAINQKDKQGNTMLHWVVINNHVHLVKWLLAQDANPDAWSPVNRTPLDLAIRNGNEQMVVQLLDAKATGMNHGGLGWMLALAAEYGHLSIVKTLLKRNADINGPISYGPNDETKGYYSVDGMPLTRAAMNGHREVAKLLIEKGSQTSGPFDIMVAHKNMPMVNLFLEMGVRPDKQAIASAILQLDKDLVERLKGLTNKKEYVESIKSYGGYGRYCGNATAKTMSFLLEIGTGTLHEAPSLLHTAVCLDAELATHFTKELLAQKLDVNARDDYGNTPLHWAAEKGNLELSQLLLKNGADIMARSEWGNTPLHRAIPASHNKIVQLLLEHGANVDVINEAGATPLHIAALRGNTDAIRMLIKRGADVNARNKLGYTPLHAAAARGWKGAVQLLIQNGANARNAGNDRVTPLHAVLEGAYIHFHQVTHFPSREFQAGEPADRLDVIYTLLGAGADVNARTKSGLTPLHTAVVGMIPAENYIRGPFLDSDQQVSVIRMLVNAGADLSIRARIKHLSDLDSTALDLAQQRMLQEEVINALKTSPPGKQAAIHK